MSAPQQSTENDAKATCRCEPRFGMPHEPWCSALDLRYAPAGTDYAHWKWQR